MSEINNEELKKQARKIITMVSETKLIADLLTALEAAEQQVAELKDRLSYKSIANRLAARVVKLEAERDALAKKLSQWTYHTPDNVTPCSELCPAIPQAWQKGRETERQRIITICEGYMARDPVHNIANAIIQAITAP